MKLAKRFFRIVATVLASWLVAFVALVWLGLLPGFGLFTLLDEIEASIVSVANDIANLAGPGTPATPVLPPQAKALVDRADEATAAGKFGDAAPLYVEALKHTDGHPELYFSASRAWRFAGKPLLAAAYMLAYIELARPEPAVTNQLLDEIDDLAAVGGATGRELFALAVESAARLPWADRAPAQIAIVRQIASAGDVDALKLIARRTPEGLPEALGPAAVDTARAGRWQLARELLDIGAAAVPAAARASAFMLCRQQEVMRACAGQIVHPGFGGLPPVASTAHCTAQPPTDMRPREQNLAGMMLMGLGIHNYHVHRKGQAHRLWQEGLELLQSSGLDGPCDQPWSRGMVVHHIGRNWIFMDKNGKVGVPPGEDQSPPDRPWQRITWFETVEPHERPSGMTLPSIEADDIGTALKKPGLLDLGAALLELNASVPPGERPIKLAELGRDYYRIYAAIQAGAAALRKGAGQ